jgi:hypothetical protein
MNRWHSIALLLGAGLLAPESPAQPTRQPGPEAALQWLTDLAAAHRLAAAQDRPLLIVFR